MKYTKLELNIGLENNSMDYDGIVDHFLLNEEFGAYQFRKAKSQYKGKPSSTVYIRAINNLRYSYIIERIELMCAIMNQESIAVKLNGQGIVVYNPAYFGEMITFDEKYFKS